MNRWSDRQCPNGCLVWVYQYDPGGRWFERGDVPHTCPAPTVSSTAEEATA